MGPPSDHILEIESTRGPLLVLGSGESSLHVLLDLRQISSLLPNLGDQGIEGAVVGDLTEGVRDFYEEVVEVHLPVALLVLDPELQNALIIIAGHEYRFVPEDVDGLNHRGEGVETLAERHPSLGDSVVIEIHDSVFVDFQSIETEGE